MEPGRELEASSNEKNRRRISLAEKASNLKSKERRKTLKYQRVKTTEKKKSTEGQNIAQEALIINKPFPLPGRVKNVYRIIVKAMTYRFTKTCQNIIYPHFSQIAILRQCYGFVHA